MAKPNKYRLNNNIKEKRCSKCHKWKQYSEFTIDKRKNDRLDYRCKKCERLRKNKYNWRNWRHKDYDYLKDQAYKNYGGYKCACCGETELIFLSIDHINNDGAEHRKAIGNSTYKLYKWLKENDYPKGFQILCMNCNWGKKRNKGVCPHKS